MLRGHVAIIAKPSPHYVLTESTISSPRRSIAPRPSPDFSPRLRDKIWEWPGNEAMAVVHFVGLLLSNQDLGRKWVAMTVAMG